MFTKRVKMKIKLSKSKWEEMGKKAGWIKESVGVHWWDDVSEFLTRRGIAHEVSAQGIMVDRDSIIKAMNVEGENESYQSLISLLNSTFGLRFNYTNKTDDWLFLEALGVK